MRHEYRNDTYTDRGMDPALESSHPWFGLRRDTRVGDLTGSGFVRDPPNYLAQSLRLPPGAAYGTPTTEPLET